MKTRWRAENGTIFYYISMRGNVCNFRESGSKHCNDRYNMKNYFKSVEEAKSSKFYKVLNEEQSA